MPIYDYECRACGHGFEVMQKLSEPKLVDCPDCAKPALKKLISPVAFRLKGTGWYETDFKNSKKSVDSSSPPSENGMKEDKSSSPEDVQSSKSSSETGEVTSKQSSNPHEQSDSPKA